MANLVLKVRLDDDYRRLPIKIDWDAGAKPRGKRLTESMSLGEGRRQYEFTFPFFESGLHTVSVTMGSEVKQLSFEGLNA